MTNKERYREFYQSHPDICIFSAPWWLDALAGDTWDVILIEQGGRIIASFPYVYTKGKLGIKKIVMPELTQKLGPYIVYEPNTTYSHKLSYEHKVYEQIISLLPAYDDFYINFDQNYKNWLPFYWNGFKQTTRYSYRLYNIKKHEDIFLGFENKRRYRIKKAINELSIKYDLNADRFYSYFEDAISDRKDTVSFTRDLFFKLYNVIYEQNSGKVMYCVDDQDNIHAVKLFVWDNKVAYSLIGMRKKEYNKSGGTEFLSWEMIKYASQFVDIFDFEGSMIKGVEQSYRYFGTQQTEYYSIGKVNNKLLKLYRALRS